MRKLLLFLCLSLLALGSTASAQDADSEAPPQINLALADLSARLGTGITLDSLDEWTYEQFVATSTSLGCNLVAGENAPQGISTYRFRLTYNGTLYEYHVAADGQIIVPCSQALQAITPLAPVDVPTEACPTGFEGYLTPRLTLNGQGQVVEGNDPNRLRSAPSTDAEQIGQINPGRTFTVVGGPSCSSQIVWWQVVVDGQVGWTAEGIAPDYFLEPLGGAASTAEATESPTAVTGEAPAELAGVVDGSLGLYNFNVDSLEEVAVIGDVAGEFSTLLYSATWSPDGGLLAFEADLTPDNDEVSTSLYVSDGVLAPVLVAESIVTAMPPTFTPDSRAILYGVISGEAPGQAANPEGGALMLMDIVQADLVTRRAPLTLATVPFGVGCGGGSPFPADFLVNSEAGAGGLGLVFALTPSGLVYSTNCTGSGLALLDLETGDSTDLGADLTRARVSPDGSLLLAIASPDGPSSGTLTVINLETGAQTPLGTAAEPSGVAWGANGEIFYSTRIETDATVPGSDTEVLSGMMPSTLFEVAIHQVDLEAATDLEIYRGEGYAVGRMVAAPDGETLLFSVIPNGEAWAAAMNSGEADGGFESNNRLFPVALNRLNLADGTVETIAPNFTYATLNAAALSQAAG